MKIIYVMIVWIITITLSFGQERESPSDTLINRFLEELVFSANKVEQPNRLVTQQVLLIRPTTIAVLNAQSAADLLVNTGVVAIQKSQQGGGSPILRGFEASRVLLVMDGIRMNNLIYRAGHLQNVITLDQSALDRTEVLFGPSTTVYGSDALGGAVVFYSKDPQLRANGVPVVSGKSYVRYSSVNQENTFHGQVNLAGEKIASFTSFTRSDFGDLRMGKRVNPALGEDFGLRRQFVRRSADNQSDELVDSDDAYLQRGSGYRQTDLMQKILFKPSGRVSHLLAMQYSNSSDVPRYDRLTDPGSGGIGLKFAEWYYGPQKRLLTYYRLNVTDLGKWADDFTLTASYQDVEESRHQRRFNSSSLQNRMEDVQVWALTADFRKTSGKNDFRYGIDGQFNQVKSTANAENIITGVSSALDTRYPGGDNTMNFLAFYATHTRELSSRFSIHEGFRFGTSQLYAHFRDKTFFPFPFDDVTQSNLTGSGSVGASWTPDNWKVSLMVASGFRSPNIDDLAKVFESVAGSGSATGTLIVPNPDLKPEKTLNLDLGAHRLIGHGRIGGHVFVTQLYDAIATRPFQLGGASTVDYDGFPADVYANQNVNRALIYGTSLQADVPLSEAFRFSGSWNYIKGVIRNDGAMDAPLDHIAPAFGRLSLSYSKKKMRGEVFSNFSAWKRLEDYSDSGEDNLQYATAKGMPSWYTLNFRFSADVSDWVTVQTGIDNLMDLQYRTFASGINAPGRNLFLTLRVNF